MKTVIKNLLLLSAFICFSCDEELPYLTLSVTDDIYFTQYALDSESVRVEIKTNQADISIIPDQDWCRIREVDGGFIVYAVPNTQNTAPPKATIKVMAGEATPAYLYAYQEAASTKISLDITQHYALSTGGSIQVQVTSNTEWTASSNREWVILSTYAGSGDEIVKVDIEGNDSAQADQAIITFKTGSESVTLTINRGEATGFISVTPSNYTMPAAGGSLHVAVTSNSPWNATSNQTWATLSKSSGLGNENLLVNVSTNNAAEADEAIITFATTSGNATLKIQREGTGSFISVTPSNYTMPAAGGNLHVKVTTNTPWTAVSDQQWATLSNSSGEGEKDIEVIVAPNSSVESDQAVITFSTNSGTAELVITREGMASTIEVTPENYTISSAGGTINVDVISNDLWTTSSNQSWAVVRQSSGSGNENIQIDISENYSEESDQAVITFSTNSGTAEFVITREGIATTIQVTPETYTISSTGGTINVDVVSNVSWTASSNRDWAVIRQSSGSGNESIQVDISENYSVESDQAVITFSTNSETAELVITREGIASTIEVTPETYTISSAGGIIDVDVVSNASWTASSNQNWAAVSQAYGNGNERIQVTVSESSFVDSDQAIITFNTGSAITQLVIIREGINPTLEVTPKSYSIPSSGGNIDVSVSSNTSWTVTSDQNWATISQASGSGDRTIQITVSENSSPERSEALITFRTGSGKVAVLTITREGASATLILKPTSYTAPSSGGNVNINVTSNAGWTATSNQSWATVSQSSGNGNDNLMVYVSQNTSTNSDQAVITFKSGNKTATFTIQRQGANENLSVSPTSSSINALGGNISALVMSNASWKVQSNQSWAVVKTASGSGNSNITITVAPNKSRSSDMATITIYTNTRSVTLNITRQAGPVYTFGDFYPDPNNAATAIGIVFALDNFQTVNGEYYALHGKIFSANATKGFPWYHAVLGFPYPVTGANSSTNGLFNVETIRRVNGNLTGYPAFNQASKKTDGGLTWYLPAVDELRGALGMKSLMNARIKQLGGVTFDVDHVTSTEYNNKQIRILDKQGRNWIGEKTTSTYYLRPVAVF